MMPSRLKVMITVLLFVTITVTSSVAESDPAPAHDQVRKHKRHRRGWVLLGHETAAEEWSRFKRYFRKVYHSPSEEEHRFHVFASSLAEARVRNAQNVAAGGEHVFGVTRFSDETPEEFNRRYKGRKGHGRGVVSGAEVRRPLAYTSALMGREGQEGGSVEVSRPPQVDWVAAGATTSIGNQGQCGSCWAFSATSQIESAFILAGHAPWRLSVQQVTSCTSGGFGCGGGDTIQAYEQLLGMETKTGMPIPGLVAAAMAPYQQSMYQECLSPLCTERCRLRQIGNLSVAAEMEALTGEGAGALGTQGSARTRGREFFFF
ncbi:cysteine proteinase [Nannochloropsis gaditana]|uniref:Cysteine proteinase n=1 Tax=Nannochloropsis gaditana TaxID=72520 RepID=W7TZC7_9STRA|nr:cysteine proteinase [Nannochloropsis gaditana]